MRSGNSPVGQTDACQRASQDRQAACPTGALIRRVRQSVAFARKGPWRFNEWTTFFSIAPLAPPMHRFWLLSFVLLLLAGCDSSVERFEPNRVFALSLARSRAVPTDAAVKDVDQVIRETFGTPDEPRWPAEMLGRAELKQLVDSERLVRAAGPVSSDRSGEHFGLYREHCVICHGLSGSGTGPTSRFQNPYPRNFRHGVFKWKSTERGAKPTRADLGELLARGVPGTAMPSFRLVAPAEREALIDYVIYLSIRGEAERELMAAAIDELGYGEEPPEPELRLVSQTPGPNMASGLIDEIVEEIASEWAEAGERVAPVPAPKDDIPFEPPGPGEGPLSEAYRQSIERGRELYHGQIANCVGCHGPAGQGGVPTLDYDDWAKEYTTRIGVTPSDDEALEPFRELGALPPRPIEPRELQDGVFRGGSDPGTLYRRITHGIAGTPMPSLEVSEEASATGVTPSQVWDLVRYVLSLSPDS